MDKEPGQGAHHRFRTPIATGGTRACRSLLAALVAVLRRVTLGPLVACVRFRNPPCSPS